MKDSALSRKVRDEADSGISLIRTDDAGEIVIVGFEELVLMLFTLLLAFLIELYSLSEFDENLGMLIPDDCF